MKSIKLTENYTVHLDTFLFKRSWAAAFTDLTDEQAGKLIKALYEYTDGKEEAPEDPEIKTSYKLLTQQLNHSACYYLTRAGLIYEYGSNADKKQT